jgi:AmmeMemoRadiSam system protein A
MWNHETVFERRKVMEEKTSPVVELARTAVESFVTYGKTIIPTDLTDEMKERAGVFVSIKKEGQLRGCIGTFEPTKGNVAEEIVSNAISSATGDPRFSPVKLSELDDLQYSVDILTPPEPVSSPDQLDPEVYGVIVESGFRRGLLLPALEGVNTAEDQIRICKMKAGIAADEPVQLYRFMVRRYK